MMWIFDGVCCFAVEMSHRCCIHWFDRFVRLISKLCLVQNKVSLCGFTRSFIQQTRKCNLFSLVRSWAVKAAALCITQACATFINHRSTVLQLHQGKTGWSLWHNQNDRNVCAMILMLLKRLLQRWYASTFSWLRSSKQLWWAKMAPKTAIKWQWEEVWTHRNFTLNTYIHIFFHKIKVVATIWQQSDIHAWKPRFYIPV